MEKLIKFLKDEEGISALEYALLGTVVLAAIATAAATLSAPIASAFSKLVSALG